MKYALLAVLAGCDLVVGFGDIAPPREGGPSDGSGCTATDPDEDSDGITDDCDPCPADPMTGSGDADHDGVDNTCDPDATGTPQKNSIIRFDGFSTDLGEYALGGWRITGGQLSIPNFTGGARTASSLLDVTRPSIDVRIEQLSSGSTGSVLVYVQDTNNVRIGCRLESTGSGYQMVSVINDVAMGTQSLVDSNVRLVLRVPDDGELRCIANTSTPLVLDTNTFVSTVHAYGVVSTDMPVTIDSLTVFDAR
ncbi:MAG TPA: hypothetical protein VGC41_07295 [Kofleriaceae bacterium]